MKYQLKDLLLRFVLGGSAVALCYVALLFIPWKSFAGIMAAFPAVMVAAIIMAGIFEGTERASEVALGAVAGMAGCTICVIATSLSLTYLHDWKWSILVGQIAWFASSVIFINFIQTLVQRLSPVKGSTDG
ncbi:MAG TPA: DUF3147 family protein [Syntrophomonadaceae bacterium]|nr:DUF3147 family protein [Syntrophomonadaceae bacterium]